MNDALTLSVSAPPRLAVPRWDEPRAFDCALLVTLLLVLLHVDGGWSVTVPASMLAVAALLHEPLRRHGPFWFLLAVTLLAGVRAGWSAADNHQYLIAYWCLALALALHTADPLCCARRSARRLIGLCFLFAVVWKLVAPDFRDGTFFHHTLLTDHRFGNVAELAAGVEPEMRRHNEAAVRALTNFDSRLGAVVLRDGTATPLVARGLTWWTLAIEGLVALAFLAPPAGRLGRRRDLFLLLFVATTYTVAPVLGFGWVLLVMGMVQAAEGRQAVRLAYAALLVALQLDLLPWRDIAERVLGGWG